MTSTANRSRLFAGLRLFGLVVLASLTLAASASASPDPPSLVKKLVGSNSGVLPPDTFGAPGVVGVNAAGDYLFTAGNLWALFLRPAAGPSPVRLLQTGDPVPGLAHTRIDSAAGVRLNASGAVCVNLQYTQGGTGFDTILTYDGSWHTIVTSTDIAPSSGGVTFGFSIGLVGFNDNGDVAFTAPVQPPGLPAHTTLFIVPHAGSPVGLVGYGDVIPGGGATFGGFSGMIGLNNSGEVLFSAPIVGGSGGYGLFAASQSGGVRKIAANGDSDLRGGSFAFTSGTPTAFLNNAGQVAFGDHNALYLSSPSTGLALKVDLTTTVPTPPGGTVTSISQSYGLDDAGDIAFAAQLSGSSGGVFRSLAAGGLETVAYHDQAAPGAPGQTLKLGSFTWVGMNSGGDVLFPANLTAGTYPTGLFKKAPGGDLSAVVLGGQPAPSTGGGTFMGFTALRYRIVEGGAVYFEAGVAGGTTDNAAFLANESEVVALPKRGDALPSGSRVLFRSPFIGGAGNYVGFGARRPGGGNSFWLADATTGVIHKVAADDDIAPRFGTRMMLGGPPNVWVNAVGAVAFPGSVAGTPNTQLFTWDVTGGLQVRVGYGDAVPQGGGLTFTGLGLPGSLLSPLSDKGDLVFTGAYSGGSGIFLAREGGEIDHIVTIGDSAPTGGTFASSNTFPNYLINREGHVAFVATTSQPLTGIFVRGDSGIVKIVATGEAAPGGGTFASFPAPAPVGFNASDQMVFKATTTGGPGTGVYLAGEGGIQAIALNGVPAPAGGNYAFGGGYLDARINDLGDVLFRAPLTGGSADSGLFLRRASTGTVEVVALQGQSAPGTSGVFLSLNIIWYGYPGEMTALGPTGEVLFTPPVDVGGLVHAAMFRYRLNGTLEKVMMSGEVLPESGGGTIANFSQGPGSGRAGRFFFEVTPIDADFDDSIYTTTFLSPAAGDADADGKSDLTVYRASTGTWYSFLTGPGDSSITQWGAPTDIPVPGDYDGDGRMDVAIFRPESGTWYVLPSSDAGGSASLQWGASGDIPVPGDYTGDGRADVVVYRPSSGFWHMLASPEYQYATYVGIQWGGAAEDIPVPADYDGDGRLDIAIYRPSIGTWYILTSSSNYDAASYVAVQWGSGVEGDIPLPGDYDGDGKADICVWRPSTGTWFILKSSDLYSAATYLAYQWGDGAGGDKPVPADYDGDGRMDLAIWRPASGTWYGLMSSANYDPASYQSIGWGSSSDVPLTMATRILALMGR